MLYPRLELEACHVDAEARVGNSLLQIWELKFGHKAKLIVQTLSTRFGQDFEVEVPQMGTKW